MDTSAQDLVDADSQITTHMDSDTQPQTATDTQPDIGTDTQPQTGTDTQPQRYTDTQPQTGTDSQPQRGTDTQPQTGSDTQPQTGSNTQPQTGTDTQPQIGTDTQPQTGTDSQPQRGTDTQPQTGTDTQPQTGTDTQPQTATDPQPQTATDAQPQTATDTQPQRCTDTQPQTGTDTQPQRCTDTQPQTGTDTQPQTGTDTQPQTGTDTQPQEVIDTQTQEVIDTQPQTGTDTQPQTGTDTQPQTGTDTQPQIGTDAQPQTATDTQPQTGSDTQPEKGTDAQPQTGTDTQPQTGTDTQPQTNTGHSLFVHDVPGPDRIFDAALMYAEEDYELADEILNGMKDIVLDGNRKAKVCLFDHPHFGAVITDKASKVKKKCNIAFLLLTRNTKSDQKLAVVSKEAVAAAYFDKLDPHVVLLLHTKPKGERDYDIPEGFQNSEDCNWFEPLSSCKKKIGTLFDDYRKLAHFPSGHGSIENQNQHSSLDGSLIDNRVISKASEETVQLKRIKDQTRSILEMCPKLFVPTRATRDARETLKKEGSVFLVGRSGDGKTDTAYHILTELKKDDPSYEIYIVSKPEDMDYIPSKNSVVFVDNIFGTSSFSSVLFEKWRGCFTYMEGYVKAGHMYFISASQNQIRDECINELGNIPLLKQIIDMSEEYCLSINEKEAMLTKFLQHYEVAMTEQDKQTAVHSQLSLGFPQCCKLYMTNSEAQKLGPSFFEGSFMFLSNQIKKMKSSENDRDKHLYLVLVMGIFEKGKISLERFDPFRKSNQFQPSSEELRQVCGIERATKDDVVSASNKLCKMGYLRCIEVNALYEFSHQSIYDAVAVIFGKVHTQQIIDLCPLKFLLDHTAISDGSQVEKKNVIMVKSELLIVRLIAELKNEEFIVLGHRALQKEFFVTELFFSEHFSKVLKEKLAKGLMESNILYYLTASKKYTMFVKRFMEELQKMRSDEQNIKRGLLHQILEGSCIAGDLIIFGKVFSMKMVTPCQQCIVKAAASPVDHPDIMTKILSRMPLECSTMERVVTSLVVKGRTNTLRRIPEKSITWSFFRGKGKKKHLLTLACLAGNFEMFQLLKEIIGEPYSTEDLLFPAVKGGNMDILEAIITEENINYVDTHGRTILHHACKKRHDLCEFLIKKGIDLDKKDSKGAQAFHKACQYMDEKSIRNLISLGFKVTLTDDGKNRLSPLHRAAKNEKGAPLVRFLKTECSTDMINWPNTEGLTPLHIASRQPYGRDFINELMRRNADHSLKDMNGMTALHHAASSINPGNIVALIDCNADVNAVDKSKRTPLHHVLKNSVETSDEIEAQRDSVIHLLKKGANVLLADNCGNTAMHVAGLSNTPAETCKALTEKDVSFELNNKGFSVLHLMLRSNASVEFLTFMVEKYPELPKINTESGDSALHVALSNHVPFDVFRMLIDKIPCAKESIKWEHINFQQVMWQYKSEDVICFLEQCAEYIPKPIPGDLLHFLCESNMSDTSWTQAMDCLKVEKSSLLQDSVQSLLHKVCSSEVKISYLVEKGANVNTRNRKGDTPLHVAATYRSDEGVEALLESGADINLCNNDNYTPLHKAVSNVGLDFQNHHHFTPNPILLYSDVHVVKLHAETVLRNEIIAIQFQYSMSVERKDRHGPTPVHLSPHSTSMLEILVKKGGNLDLTTNDGLTCLHLACLNGDNISVRYLFKCMSSQYCDVKEKKCKDMKTMKRVEPTDRDMKNLFKEGRDGVLPIHCAVISGNIVVVKLVAEAMKAAAGKNSDTGQTKKTKMLKPKVPILMGHGKQGRKKSQEVSPSTTGSKRSQAGKTQSNPKLSNSQQPNLQKIMMSYEKKHKYTLLQYAVQFSTVEIIQFLLKEGWELKSVDEVGNTLLHYAARWNRREATEYLLKEKLDVHCFNKEGLMPLHVAAESYYDSKQCIDLLLRDDNASVTKLTQKKKRNLLHLLCKSSPASLSAYSMYIFDTEKEYSLTLMPLPWLLIEKGCDVNGKDADNMTPLHFAAEANNALLVDILLENNANIDAVDSQGRTPLHLALQTSHSFHSFRMYPTALLLAKQGANPHAVDCSGETPIDILMKMDKSTLKTSPDIKKICQLFKIWEEVKPV